MIKIIQGKPGTIKMKNKRKALSVLLAGLVSAAALAGYLPAPLVAPIQAALEQVAVFVIGE